VARALAFRAAVGNSLIAQNQMSAVPLRSAKEHVSELVRPNGEGWPSAAIHVRFYPKSDRLLHRR
jgi:hypothetical protein